MWAGVSGYMESGESPVERAVIEIEEETGILNPRLVREGGPVEAFDAENDTKWVVHPFLFEVDTRDVVLDWEHTKIKWVKPGDFSEFSTVPKLEEVFANIWRNKI